LNDKFLIPSLLRTKIILSWDENIIVSSSSLNEIFTFYLQKNLTTYIVSPFDRGCKRPRYQSHNRNYTLVLTGFAFLIIDLLELYHRPEYGIGREELTRLFIGEDMLVNFITTSVYHTKPILVYMPCILTANVAFSPFQATSSCDIVFAALFQDSLLKLLFKIVGTTARKLHRHIRHGTRSRI
jgi:hypothetical protein